MARFQRHSTFLVFSVGVVVHLIVGASAFLKPNQLKAPGIILPSIVPTTTSTSSPNPNPNPSPSQPSNLPVPYPSKNHQKASSDTYKNPLSSVLGSEDPFVYYHNDGNYYYVSTSAAQPQSIFVMRSPKLAEWEEAFEDRKIVFNVSSPYTHIRQPEIHHVDGSWLIYFSMGVDDELSTSRNFVIQSRDGANPKDAVYGDLIQLAPSDGGEATGFHGTLLQYGRSKDLYFIWAGYSHTRPYNKTETDINLYIAPMNSPTQLSGPAVLLRAPSVSWEGTTVESPQVLQHPLPGPAGEDRVFIVYSVSDKDDPNSCLGMIRIDFGFSPLVEENWKDVQDGQCVFWSNEKQKVFSVRGASFTNSPDNSETWILYTASESSSNAEKSRSVRLEKIAWNSAREPVFPRPAGLQIAFKAPKGIPTGCTGWSTPSMGCHRSRETVLPGFVSGPITRLIPENQGVTLPTVVPASTTVEPPAPGGLSTAVPVDDNVRSLVQKLAGQIHAEACKKLKEAKGQEEPTCQGDLSQLALTPLTYKDQVVAGTNYFVKLRRGDHHFFHARIFEQDWTDTLSLHGVTGPKSEADEIEYF